MAVAAARDVVVFRGWPWLPAEPPGPFLRLSFTGRGARRLDEGVRRLAGAVRAT